MLHKKIFLTICWWVMFELAQAAQIPPQPQKDSTPKNGKYVVFPGLDVDNGAIAGWLNGYSSPWNVFFGAQPYVVGWVGEDYENDEPPFGFEDSGADYETQEVEDYQSEIVMPIVEAPHDQVTEDRGKEKKQKRKS